MCAAQTSINRLMIQIRKTQNGKKKPPEESLFCGRQTCNRCDICRKSNSISNSNEHIVEKYNKVNTVKTYSI